MRIVVLGSTGMLGFALHRVLHDAGHDVIGTRRSQARADHPWQRDLRSVIVDDFAQSGTWSRAIRELAPEIVVNAAGVIKQVEGGADLERLLRTNSVFPRQLAIAGEASGFRVIHFSTDCVFKGTRGKYQERDVPDSTDPYGLSKFLGEIGGPAALTIRTSLIGRGLRANSSLVDWFLGQTGVVPGYTNAVFSGLPVHEIATVTRDILLPRLSALTGLYHLSAEPTDKFRLLELIRREWRRSDIELRPDDRVAIDRSLDSTKFRDETGYQPPKWLDLVQGMKRFYESLDSPGAGNN